MDLCKRDNWEETYPKALTKPEVQECNRSFIKMAENPKLRWLRDKRLKIDKELRRLFDRGDGASKVMPITEDQVKFYLSGGSTNSNVFASIGGPISTMTQIRQDEFNNLWGDIGALDLKTGVTQYRAVYMKNESNNTIFENPRSYFAIKDSYVSNPVHKTGGQQACGALGKRTNRTTK